MFSMIESLMYLGVSDLNKSLTEARSFFLSLLGVMMVIYFAGIITH